MLNENTKYEKLETKSYPLLKEDVYQVQLIDVNEFQGTKYQSNEPEITLDFVFAVLQGKNADGEDARKRVIKFNFVPVYLYISKKTGKNKLYQAVEALVGKELNREEEASGITGKTLNYLIGKQARVFIENKVTEKGTYSNIIKLSKIESEMTPFTKDEVTSIKNDIAEYEESKKENTKKEWSEASESQEDTPIEKIPF